MKILDVRGTSLLTWSEVAERFMGGFEYRTHALSWQLSVMRDKFENFRPNLPAGYDFDRKWAFVMWSLERQERRMQWLRRIFMEKVALVESAPQSGAAELPDDFDCEISFDGGGDSL